MSKYTVNMSDQLNKVRVNTQEKLKKEAEVVVEIEQPSALQSATADYLSRKEEPHPLGSPTNLNEMKKVEIKLNRGNVDKDIQKIVKHIGLVNKKRRANQQIKITQNMSDDSVTLDGGKNVDIDREVADIRNFIGYKSAKVVESVEEETLDEGKFKVGDTVIPSVGPHKGRKHEVIADLKNNTYNIKPIGLLAKQIQYRLGAAKAKANQIKLVKEETLDEREKSVRQLVNPTKEVMVVKKNKVVVIDKKDQDKYIKQGWALAEENKLEEARWKVKIEGLPPIYMDSKSSGEVRSQLRKLIKTPDMIQDIERVTDAEVKKALRNKISGKEVEEKLDKDDEDSVGDVVKQLKKAVKAHQGQVKSLTKDMQDELQVKEWFKSKNIDVKVRELEESTQVYVPLGRRIPNEIREELITTQYGKMPEDVKNVKDINYGNFMENSITMNNDFWSKVLHGTKGE